MTARLAATKGFAVIVNDLPSRESAIEAVVARIREARGKAIGIQADVTDELAVEQLFSRAVESAGPIVGLVNSAGVDSTRKAVADLSAGELHRLFSVNTIGTMLCCRSAVRRM